MKEAIYNILESNSQMTVGEIALNIFIAAVLGFFIFLSYYISHRGTIYSKKFNASLVMLTILTGTVMTVIGNNIALSLGMVGALSIVRFRTAIKDSRDTVYIFWTIIAGICCGVGDYAVAAIGSVITFIVMLIFGLVKSDNRLLVIIRADRNKQAIIQTLIFKLFDRKAVLRVRNTSDDTVELIYEITSKVLEKAESENANVTNAIYEIGGIQYVNIVMQNDEVSN